MSDSGKAYIGISPCGCVTAALVAGVLPAASEKADLKRWMRSGRKVEITTCGEARERLVFDCPHESGPRTRQEIEAEATRLFKEAHNA